MSQAKFLQQQAAICIHKESPRPAVHDFAAFWVHDRGNATGGKKR